MEFGVRTEVAIIARALAIWLVLICAEILHGIARGIFLVPHVGEFRSNQIGVFTGSIIILVIALAFVRWIGASRTTDLWMVGLRWLGLTLAFEILFGRFVVGASWERLGTDYNVLEGGLLPFGMIVLLLVPLIAGKVRGTAPTVWSNLDVGVAMGERHGASRRWRPEPAASAVPLTIRGFSLDNAPPGKSWLGPAFRFRFGSAAAVGKIW